MKRWVLVLVLFSVLLGGCLEFQEHLDLNRDGSGQLSMLVGIDLSMLNMFDEDSDMSMDTEIDVSSEFSGIEGVTVLRNEQYQEDSLEWSDLVISFVSLEHLMATQSHMDEDGEIEKGSLGEISWSRDDGGYYVYQRVLPLFGNEDEEEMDEMTKAMLFSFFGEVFFLYSVTFPGGVLDANAPIEDIDSNTNTVTWSFSLPSMMLDNQVMWAKIAR